jgi:hypothetical protein
MRSGGNIQPDPESEHAHLGRGTGWLSSDVAPSLEVAVAVKFEGMPSGTEPSTTAENLACPPSDEGRGNPTASLNYPCRTPRHSAMSRSHRSRSKSARWTAAAASTLANSAPSVPMRAQPGDRPVNARFRPRGTGVWLRPVRSATGAAVRRRRHSGCAPCCSGGECGIPRAARPVPRRSCPSSPR